MHVKSPHLAWRTFCRICLTNCKRRSVPTMTGGWGHCAEKCLDGQYGHGRLAWACALQLGEKFQSIVGEATKSWWMPSPAADDRCCGLSRNRSPKVRRRPPGVADNGRVYALPGRPPVISQLPRQMVMDSPSGWIGINKWLAAECHVLAVRGRKWDVCSAQSGDQDIMPRLSD